MVSVKNESSFLIHNIKFRDELLDVLKLPKKNDYIGSILENPVNLDDIKLTLNDTDFVYLRFHKINANYVLENSIHSSLMAFQYSTDNNKPINYKDLNPLFHNITSRKMVYNLHFSIENPKGNDLPFYKTIFIVFNKPRVTARKEYTLNYRQHHRLTKSRPTVSRRLTKQSCTEGSAGQEL